MVLAHAVRLLERALDDVELGVPVLVFAHDELCGPSGWDRRAVVAHASGRRTAVRGAQPPRLTCAKDPANTSLAEGLRRDSDEHVQRGSLGRPRDAAGCAIACFAGIGGSCERIGTTNAAPPHPVDRSRLLRSPRRRPEGRTAARSTRVRCARCAGRKRVGAGGALRAHDLKARRARPRRGRSLAALGTRSAHDQSSRICDRVAGRPRLVILGDDTCTRPVFGDV